MTSQRDGVFKFIRLLIYKSFPFFSHIKEIMLKRILDMRKSPGLSYKDSGVDIAAGDNLVSNIKPLAKSTSRTGCVSEIGSFGGVFDIKAAGYKDPLLVSGTDGVGTKLKIAQACDNHKSVGIDLVAMCVNDILAHGAEPLYFLDYFACGKLEVGIAAAVIEGVATGCKQAGCALLGGETAEMPGMYSAGDYDLAGFAVGAVERNQLLPQSSDIQEGDAVIGLASSGIHSNGFSLVRKVVEHCGLDMSSACPFNEKKTLGEAMLCPTKIYVKSVLPVMHAGKIKAFAHITGGGLPGNVGRVLPDGLGARLEAAKWDVPSIFGWIAAKGNVEVGEMARTFNCGVGGVLVVNNADSKEVIDKLKSVGETATLIGKITKLDQGADPVDIVGLGKALEKAYSTKGKHRADEPLTSDSDKKLRVNGSLSIDRKKVGVLISGSGTNLQALIEFTQNPDNHSSAEIVLVISNKPDVQGLKRAEDAGISTKVINHKDYEDRAKFDEALNATLTEANVDIVCLAGFMRILTGDFVHKWEGRMLNVHPSLLPSFKGGNAHKLVIAAGVRISGCTIHFVAEEVDAGAILVQESVPVFPGDTEESLAERVKTVEHKAFPRALELVTSGAAKLEDGKIKWSLKP